MHPDDLPTGLNSLTAELAANGKFSASPFRRARPSSDVIRMRHSVVWNEPVAFFLMHDYASSVFASP
jgi:hypothetical protein